MKDDNSTLWSLANLPMCWQDFPTFPCSFPGGQHCFLTCRACTAQENTAVKHPLCQKCQIASLLIYNCLFCQRLPHNLDSATTRTGTLNARTETHRCWSRKLPSSSDLVLANFCIFCWNLSAFLLEFWTEFGHSLGGSATMKWKRLQACNISILQWKCRFPHAPVDPPQNTLHGSAYVLPLKIIAC